MTSMPTDGVGPPRVRGLGRIAEFCRVGVERTAVDAITVTYADAFGGLELLLATDDVAEQVAQVEFAIGEGPSFDAVSSGHVTLVDDLRGPVATHRWPLFATEAVHAGVRALWAYPVKAPNGPLGTVGLYRRRPGRLTSDQHRQAEAITELIGLALVEPASGASIGSGLRMDVHRAAGMVMVQADLGIQDALVLLRSTAFAEDTRVTDLAGDIISGRRRLGKEAHDVHG